MAMPSPHLQSSFNEAELERGRWLFAQQCEFIMGAAEEHQLPESPHPEVAFAGRSNVGKSSLVNALTGRKTLARTSNTPGRTQQVNFFNLNSKLMLVDLPGYGYARASKTEIGRWNKLIRDYLKGRSNLRRVFILIDARHGLKDNDLEVMAMLDEAAVIYQIVFTKTDKVKQDALSIMIDNTFSAISKRAAAHPDLIATSAVKNFGIADLRATAAALAEWH